MTNSRRENPPFEALRAGVESMMSLDPAELSDGELAATVLEFRRQLDRQERCSRIWPWRVTGGESAVKTVPSQRPRGYEPGRGCAPVRSMRRSTPVNSVRSSPRRAMRGVPVASRRVRCGASARLGCPVMTMNSPQSNPSSQPRPAAKIIGRSGVWHNISNGVRVATVACHPNVMVWARRSLVAVSPSMVRADGWWVHRRSRPVRGRDPLCDYSISRVR